VNLLHVETGFREHGELLSEETIGRLIRAVIKEKERVSFAAILRSGGKELKKSRFPSSLVSRKQAGQSERTVRMV